MQSYPGLMPESMKVIMVGVSFEMNSKNDSRIHNIHIPYEYYIYGMERGMGGCCFQD